MRSLQSILLLALSLASCDTIAWGYVNRLPYPSPLSSTSGITTFADRSSPESGSIRAFGHNRSFDLLGPDGGLFARYRPSQLRVVDRNAFSYVVIQRGEIVVEPKDQALAGLPPTNPL